MNKFKLIIFVPEDLGKKSITKSCMKITKIVIPIIMSSNFKHNPVKLFALF